jgi:hypothetical protein
LPRAGRQKVKISKLTGRGIIAVERRKYTKGTTKKWRRLRQNGRTKPPAGSPGVRDKPGHAGAAAVRAAGGAGRGSQGVSGERESAGRRTDSAEEARFERGKTAAVYAGGPIKYGSPIGGNLLNRDFGAVEPGRKGKADYFIPTAACGTERRLSGTACRCCVLRSNRA